MIDFTELAEKTIQSQYGASPHIVALITEFKDKIDPTAELEQFYKTVFDPETATGFGLDIWGVIVGISRYLDCEYGDFFGFYGSDRQPFNQAPFYYDAGDTPLYKLEDEAYRKLIFLKARINISDTTLPTTRDIVRQLFESDLCNVFNDGLMAVRFYLYNSSAAKLNILTHYVYELISAGVLANVSVFDFDDPTTIFGFKCETDAEIEQPWAPFDNGRFGNHTDTTIDE